MGPRDIWHLRAVFSNIHRTGTSPFLFVMLLVTYKLLQPNLEAVRQLDLMVAITKDQELIIQNRKTTCVTKIELMTRTTVLHQFNRVRSKIDRFVGERELLAKQI